MIQKFYDDTLASKFVKQLLASENIPLCNLISPGDMIYKNQFYIYDSFLIYVVESGPFYIDTVDVLYPSEQLYPSVDVYPSTGGLTAKYRVVSRYSYNKVIPKLTYSYQSNMNAYDPSTHLHFGRYLRYRSAFYGINLMPFYNCYSGQTTDDVYLQQSVTDGMLQVNIIPSTHSEFKIYCVPVKFNKEYTVAIDCGAEVYTGFRLFNTDYGSIYDADHNDLSDSLRRKNSVRYTSSFTKPFKVSCNLDNDSMQVNENLFRFENDLQLLIQVPSTNTSSLVVLEGDYTESTDTTHNLLDNTLVDKLLKKEHNDEFAVLRSLNIAEMRVKFNPKPLLLSLNTKTNYAFSYRLIEHLLENSINSTETLPENILKLQQLLQRKDSIYAYRTTAEQLPAGSWSSRMDNALCRQIATMSENYYLTDMNGEFNVDMERYYQNIRKVNLNNGSKNI